MNLAQLLRVHRLTREKLNNRNESTQTMAIVPQYGTKTMPLAPIQMCSESKNQKKGGGTER